ncbi:MAG: response regulator [Spirochaetes bacterium]|nr:response regulator [Spirochaetota bacterium]
MNLTGKILIVDDDKMTLNFFYITLSKLGFEVIRAEDGEDALEKVKLYSPDLVLLDNILPKLTGFDVTRRIRKTKEFKTYRNTPIIMFSALNEPKDKVRGLEMGVDDYITKPFNFSEVLARIRTIFRHKELSHQLLQRERRLAILESLNANLISFTRHIKKPLSNLYEEINKIDYSNKSQLMKFIRKFEEDYKEMLAMLDGLEEEIIELEQKGDNLKKGELSLEELEKKIIKHLKSSSKTMSGE